MVRSKKELAVVLSRFRVFDNPRFSLEQYPTDSEVAADLLWNILLLDPLIKNKSDNSENNDDNDNSDNNDDNGLVVADLGAGTGILGIGASLLFADKVLFFEKDEDAVFILRDNLSLLEGADYEIFVTDLLSPNMVLPRVDLVVMNPPFGTRNAHLDREFLKVAFAMADTVYSLHKTSTKEFVLAFAKDSGFRVFFEKDYDFLIKNTMSHHRKRNERIKVTGFGFKRIR